MTTEFMKKCVRQIKVLHPKVNEIKFDLQFLVRKIFKLPHEDHLYMLTQMQMDKPEEDYLFIDIGANRGQTIESVRCLRNFRIISIEPLPFLFEKLNHRYINDDRIQLINKFASNLKAEFEVYIPIYNGVYFDGLASYSPLNAKSFFCASKFLKYQSSKLKLEQIKVESITIDELGIAPDFIKVDVQGAEMQVLEGAKNIIAKHEPIIILERPDLDEEVKYLSNYGYVPYLYLYKHRLFRRGHNGYNVIFLKNKHKDKFSSNCFEN